MQMGSKSNRLVSDALKQKSAPLVPPRADAPFVNEWGRLVGGFDEGYFSEADVPLMEQYVSLVLTVRDIEKQMASEPLLLDSTAGPRQNPVTKILSAYRKDMMGLARLLRVGPATRSRNSTTKTKSPSSNQAGRTHGSVVPIAGARNP